MSTDLRKLRHQPFRILGELSQRLGTGHPDEGGADDTQQWAGLGLRLGEHWLVLPRHEVGEVLRPPRLTRVPGGKPWLMGVANVRGALVPMVDLGVLLGGAHAGPDGRAVVHRGAQISTAFLVDEVAGFRRFGPGDQRHELRDDAPEAIKPFLLGAFVGEGNPWLIFSLNRLVGSHLMTSAGR